MAYHFRLHTTLDHAPLYGDALEPYFPALSIFAVEEDSEDWLLDGYSSARPDMVAIDTALALVAASLDQPAPSYSLEKLEPKDWVAENQAQFPALQAGRFYIYGSHIAAEPPKGVYPLLINAGNAFGTGEHASTKGCLLGLTHLQKRYARPGGRIVDVGTGSGVLAMAALKGWRSAHVAAGDVDAPSVQTARDNALANHLPAIRPVVAKGLQHPALQQHSPYWLIIANILARPLCALSPTFARQLQPGGYVLLAGLTNKQVAMVCHAYRQQRLHLIKRFRLGAWSTLLLRKC